MVAIDDLVAAVRAIDEDQRPGRPTSVRRRPAVTEALRMLVELGHGDTANAVSEGALVAHLRQMAHRLAVEHHYERYPEDRPGRAQVAAVRLRRDGDPLSDETDLLQRAEKLLVRAHDRAPTTDEVIAAARAFAAMAPA